MELSTYLILLNRRKWVVILTALAALTAFLIGQQLMPPSYQADTVLRIIPYSTGEPPYTQLVYADRIMNTYVRLATSGPYLDELRSRLRLDKKQPTSVKAEIIPGSELLQITLKDRDPYLVREEANTLAKILVNENPIRGIMITIVDPAILPEPPSTLKNILFMMMALIVGILGGIGLAFLFENLDNRLYTVEQVETVSGLPILGEIPLAKRGQKIDYLRDNFLLSDAINRLRTHLISLSKNESIKTILITSPMPKEGKSTIAANLAKSLSNSYRQVLLVDADLHHPSIHQTFDISKEIGLSSVLEHETVLAEAVQETCIPGVFVLPSGQVPSSPIEMIISDEMKPLLAEVKDCYDLVLVDGPAFLGAADSAQLAPLVDGVLIVTRLGFVEKTSLEFTCQQLRTLHANLTGIVVNRSRRKTLYKYPNYYKHFHIRNHKNGAHKGSQKESAELLAQFRHVKDLIHLISRKNGVDPSIRKIELHEHKNNQNS